MKSRCQSIVVAVLSALLFLVVGLVLLAWQAKQAAASGPGPFVPAKGRLAAPASAATDPNWFGYASGNDARSNVIVDGNDVWVGTGGGVMRWDRTTYGGVLLAGHTPD